METGGSSEHALGQSSFLLGHHFLFKHPGTDQELSPNCWAFGTGVMGGTAQTGATHTQTGQARKRPIQSGKANPPGIVTSRCSKDLKEPWAVAASLSPKQKVARWLLWGIILLF